MRQFFEYWVMFEQLGADGDLTIGLEEFKKAAPLLEKCGAHATDHPEETFKAIAKESGKLNYDEFCAYAAAHNLQCDDNFHLTNEDLETIKKLDIKNEYITKSSNAEISDNN